VLILGVFSHKYRLNTTILRYDQQQHRWIYLSYNRLRITNRGGRTVSLIGIKPPEKPKELPMVLPVKNGKIDENIETNVSIFVSPSN